MTLFKRLIQRLKQNTFLYRLLGFMPKQEARMMTKRESKEIINARHDGLVIDGYKLRLTREASFSHLAVLGPSGQGKTSRVILPNLLQLDDVSLVITDPSRELYEKSSGCLAQKGYNVQLIDFSRPNQSLGFNPLHQLKFEEAGLLAHILIKSANYQDYCGSSKFWYISTEQLVKLVIQLLIAWGNSEFINLPNVRHLLNYVLHPDFVSVIKRKLGGEYSSLIASFEGLLAVNRSMLQSYIAVAMSSLQLVENQELAGMLINQEIDLELVRSKKTAIFVSVPAEKMDYYSFLLNLFYAQLFQVLLQKPRAEDLDVFLILEEAGHLAVPNFDSVITNIRKMNCSILGIYQASSQLEALYGKHKAHTILNGGYNHKLILPGADFQSALPISQAIGSIEKRGVLRSLLPPDRIRVRSFDQAIFLCSDQEPLEVHMRPYFLTTLKRFSEIPPVPCPVKIPGQVKLLNIERLLTR